MTIVNVLSISGGKDSTAMWLLALERKVDNLVCVFADTGHEHPLTYDYIEYLESKLGTIRRVQADFTREFAVRRNNLPKKWSNDGVPQEQIDQALALLHPTGIPFLDLCMLKGRFPSTRARFCTQELKHFPIEKQVMLPLMEDYDEIWSWQGVRAQESRARANLSMWEFEPDIPGLCVYRPILKWGIDDVFGIHKKHNIDPNPLYKMGAGRVGCSPCIHARKEELKQWGTRFPNEVARVRKWELLVSDVSKRGASTFFAPNKTPGEHQGKSTEIPRIDEVVKWSRTTRGGMNYDVFVQDELENVPACSSIYGLCE